MIDIDLTELTRINTRLSEEIENLRNIVDNITDRIYETGRIINITGFSDITEKVRIDVKENADNLSRNMSTINGFITEQLTGYSNANEEASNAINALNNSLGDNSNNTEIGENKSIDSVDSLGAIWGVDDGSYIMPGNSSINTDRLNNANSSTQNTTAHTNPAFQDMIDNPVDPAGIRTIEVDGKKYVGHLITDEDTIPGTTGYEKMQSYTDKIGHIPNEAYIDINGDNINEHFIYDRNNPIGAVNTTSNTINNTQTIAHNSGKSIVGEVGNTTINSNNIS